MSSVSVLDLTPLRRGEPPGRRRLAQEIDRALRELGFFVVVGHGISRAETEETIETCKRFFDLPIEERRKVANRGTPFRGYVGFGNENLSYTEDTATPSDWKEFYTMGRPDRSDPYYHRPDLAATFKPNVWPASMPELRPAMERHYRSMEALATLVMQGLALALGLDDDFFRNKLDRHDSTLRAANYPHQDRAPAPGQLRAGAHTDYGAITLLAGEDAPGGLQIRTRAGVWTDVAVPPEGFVVNIGDLMMTWTNDRWLSNLHRVVNPPPDAFGSTRRLSLVHFVNCNPDARIECLPTCTDADHPPRHPPLTAGEHRRKKIEKSVRGPASPVLPEEQTAGGRASPVNRPAPRHGAHR